MGIFVTGEGGEGADAIGGRLAMGVCGGASSKFLPSAFTGITGIVFAAVVGFATSTSTPTIANFFCWSLILSSFINGIAVSGGLTSNPKSKLNDESSIGVSRTGGKCERLLIPDEAVTAERGVEPDESLVPDSQVEELGPGG